MNKTFPYPGIKAHLIKYMPMRVEGHFYDLFLGSGLVSYNIDVSKKHTAVDLDPNVMCMHKSIKRFSWKDMDKLQSWVLSRWDLSCKTDYYAYRSWFNKNLWSTQHEKTGLGLLLLARSCINGLLRFGPNGFNQSSGLRFIPYTNSSYSILHERAQYIDFVCDDFRNLKIIKNSFVYADPPYLTNPIETYSSLWKPETLRQTLSLCKNHVFWYTDTENKINASFIKHHRDTTTTIILKPMRTQSPGSKKLQVLTGRNELLVTNWVNKFYGNARK